MTITCKLSKNGHGVTSKALVDSGANGFVFINTLFAVDLAKYLGLKAQPLPRTIKVKGYDGGSHNYASHYLRLHLTIDGRRQ
jgi:hypothetical protein